MHFRTKRRLYKGQLRNLMKPDIETDLAERERIAAIQTHNLLAKRFKENLEDLNFIEEAEAFTKELLSNKKLHLKFIERSEGGHVGYMDGRYIILRFEATKDHLLHNLPNKGQVLAVRILFFSVVEVQQKLRINFSIECSREKELSYKKDYLIRPKRAGGDKPLDIVVHYEGMSFDSEETHINFVYDPDATITWDDLDTVPIVNIKEFLIGELQSRILSFVNAPEDANLYPVETINIPIK